MSSFLIRYVLHKPGQDYRQIIDAIESLFPNWMDIARATWIVQSSKTACQIAETLRSYIDSNDQLTVLEIGHDAACYNQSDEYLKKLGEFL